MLSNKGIIGVLEIAFVPTSAHYGGKSDGDPWQGVQTSYCISVKLKHESRR